MSDYNKIDQPEILSHIFHPQAEDRTAPPEAATDLDLKMTDGTILGCRFHTVSKEAPTILYFHGNGETVSGYDSIAMHYSQHGMNLFVATYRGYGWSTGSPTVSAMFADAQEVFAQLQNWLNQNSYTGPIFIMGRSLGSAVAIDLTAANDEAAKGMILESAFSDTLPLLHTLGVDTTNTNLSESDGMNNCLKITTIKIPTFILHGSADSLITLAQAEKLQATSGARNKQFQVIPGAEHNTMIATGGDLYFQAIKKFIDTVCGVNDWRRRRKRLKKTQQQ